MFRGRQRDGGAKKLYSAHARSEHAAPSGDEGRDQEEDARVGGRKKKKQKQKTTTEKERWRRRRRRLGALQPGERAAERCVSDRGAPRAAGRGDGGKRGTSGGGA